MKTAIRHSPKAVLGLVLFSSVAVAELPEVAEPCVVCHQKDGISDDPEIPTIAGASAYFLENQLAIFDAEARPCEAGHFADEPDVYPIENHCEAAGGLSEDQIVAIAEHYASQPFKPADQEVDAELASKGASIHEKSCERCHSNAGSLALDDAGILAGQWKPYLLEQFRYYKEGERWQPEKMKPVMEKLSKDDMLALAEFYAREGKK